MTTRDAARLTLALMTGASPNRAIDYFDFYRKFQNDEFEHIQSAIPVKVLGFKREDTAEDFLVYLIDFFRSMHSLDERFPEIKRVEYSVHERPAYVVVKGIETEIFFVPTEQAEVGPDVDGKFPFPSNLLQMEGMHSVREISSLEIEEIASAFGVV